MVLPTTAGPYRDAELELVLDRLAPADPSTCPSTARCIARAIASAVAIASTFSAAYSTATWTRAFSTQPTVRAARR